MKFRVQGSGLWVQDLRFRALKYEVLRAAISGLEDDLQGSSFSSSG